MLWRFRKHKNTCELCCILWSCRCHSIVSDHDHYPYRECPIRDHLSLKCASQHTLAFFATGCVHKACQFRRSSICCLVCPRGDCGLYDLADIWEGHHQWWNASVHAAPPISGLVVHISRRISKLHQPVWHEGQSVLHCAWGHHHSVGFVLPRFCVLPFPKEEAAHDHNYDEYFLFKASSSRQRSQDSTSAYGIRSISLSSMAGCGRAQLGSVVIRLFGRHHAFLPPGLGCKTL